MKNINNTKKNFRNILLLIMMASILISFAVTIMPPVGPNYPPAGDQPFETLEDSLLKNYRPSKEILLSVTNGNYAMTSVINYNNGYSRYLTYYDEKGYTYPHTVYQGITIPLELYNIHYRSIKVVDPMSMDIGTMYMGDQFCVFVNLWGTGPIENYDVFDSLGSEFVTGNVEDGNNIASRYYLAVMDELPSDYEITVGGHTYEPNKWYNEQNMWTWMIFIIMNYFFALVIGKIIINKIHKYKQRKKMDLLNDIF